MEIYDARTVSLGYKGKSGVAMTLAASPKGSPSEGAGCECSEQPEGVLAKQKRSAVSDRPKNQIKI